MPRRRPSHLPVTDPAHVPDVFANDFEVQDWEDWLRLVCTVDDKPPQERGDGGDRTERRKAAAIVIPRSSLEGLLQALRASVGEREKERRQN